MVKRALPRAHFNEFIILHYGKNSTLPSLIRDVVLRVPHIMPQLYERSPYIADKTLMISIFFISLPPMGAYEPQNRAGRRPQADFRYGANGVVGAIEPKALVR